MTDDDSPPGCVNERLAERIMGYLRVHPTECIVIRGRIGALPHVRYHGDGTTADAGDWQVASWAGHGHLKTGVHDDAWVRDAFASGPRLELMDVADADIWAMADDRGLFDA